MQLNIKSLQHQRKNSPQYKQFARRAEGEAHGAWKPRPQSTSRFDSDHEVIVTQLPDDAYGLAALLGVPAETIDELERASVENLDYLMNTIMPGDTIIIGRQTFTLRDIPEFQIGGQYMPQVALYWAQEAVRGNNHPIAKQTGALFGLRSLVKHPSVQSERSSYLTSLLARDLFTGRGKYGRTTMPSTLRKPFDPPIPGYDSRQGWEDVAARLDRHYLN